MKYSKSIIVTIFGLLFSCIFMQQLVFYGQVPPVYWIVMGFLWIFIIMTWFLQVKERNEKYGEIITYRIIKQSSLFSVIAFFIQCIVVALFLFVWNAQSENVAGLQVISIDNKPDMSIWGLLFFEVILLLLTCCLIAFNKTVNQDTVAQEVKTQQQNYQKTQIVQLLKTLSQNVSMENKENRDLVRFIEQKAEALPLVLNQDSAEKITQLTSIIRQIKIVSKEEQIELLKQIKSIISTIR